MSTGKTYSTKYLLDSNNNRGAEGQVLSTTSTGIDWVDANTVPGTGLWLENGNDIYNSNSGNVGIGTTNPNGKLEVNGIVKIGNATTGLSMNGNSTTEFLISGVDTSGSAWNSIHIKADGNDGLFIEKDTNNVGIGTTSPSQALTVEGNIELGTGGFIYGDTTTPHLKLNTAAGSFLQYGSSSWVGVGSNVVTFKTGGSERMRVTSAGNVGIGITFPDTKLTIENASGGAASTTYSTTAANANLHLSAVGVPYYNHLFMGIGSATYAWIQSQHGNSIAQNLALNPIGGNVGIGTTTPSVALDVSGEIAIRGGEAADDARMYFRASDNSNRFTIETDFGGTTGNDLLGFRSASADNILVLKGDGNVGIGTTSPGSKLDINGVTTSLGFRTAAANTNWSLISRDSAGNSPLYVQSANTSANQTIAKFNYGSTTANGGSNVLTVAKDNSYFLNTDVGIGTASPSAGLQVALGGTAIPTAGSSTASAVFGNSTSDNNYGLAIGANSNGVGYISSQRTDGAATTYNLAIQPNGGNVGIGTTNPASKLDIVNAGLSTMFRLSNTEANATTKYGAILGRHYTNAEENITGMLITSSSSATGGTVSIGGGISAANAANNVIFYTAANNTTLVGSERMRINSSGNVGIGTTSPTAPLHIEGGTNNEVLKIEADVSPFIRWVKSGSDVGFLQFTSTSAYLSNMSNGSFFFRTNNTDKMTITSAGNVGIGTTSPASKLEVNGSIDANGGDGYLINGMGFAIESSGVLSLGDWDGNDFQTRIMDQNAVEVLRVNDEKVGIGTTTPGSKLDIVGATNTSDSSLLRVRTTDNPNSPEKVVGFYVNTSTERGFISVNQYATAYSTSSDYRLKENIVPIHNSIERLKELKPCRFNFVQGDPNHVVDGFIAHEAAEVIPEAVTGEKDAVDENNNPSYQGIDQSKVVPLLTAALKEAINKIEQLETRIQTLENN